MQSTKLCSVPFQCCITQQSIVRFILILLTCHTLGTYTYLLDSKRGIKKTQILILVSEMLLESIEDKIENPNSCKIA